MARIPLKVRVRMTMETAKTLLRKDGFVKALVLFYLDGSEDPLPFPLDVATREKKYESQDFMKAFILRNRPEAAILVMDAWIGKPKTGKEYRDGDLEKDPEHMECLCVIGKSRTGGTATAIQQYHTEDDKVVFDALPPELEKGLKEGGYWDSAFFGESFEMLQAEEAKRRGGVH